MSLDGIVYPGCIFSEQLLSLSECCANWPQAKFQALVKREVQDLRERSMGNGTGFYTPAEMKTELKWDKCRPEYCNPCMYTFVSTLLT